MRLRAVEGGGRGGLDPRRARLARIHDASILGLAASAGAFLLVGFVLAAGQWSENAMFWTRLAMATLAVSAVMCVVTIYTVALLFEADPRTLRARRHMPPGWEDVDPDE